MHQNLLVELDMIFDTRLGIISQFYKDQLIDFPIDKYRSRKVDDFNALLPVIDNDEFAKYYSNRDTTTLKHSRISDFVVFLTNVLHKLVRDSIDTPWVESLTLTVNLYPYKFTEIEKDTFKAYFSNYVPREANIELVYLPYESITPGLIKEKFSFVALYDLNRWLALQFDALEKTRIPTVTLVVPALFLLGSNEEDRTFELPNVGPVEAFAALEYKMVEYVELTMIDAKYVSIVDIKSL